MTRLSHEHDTGSLIFILFYLKTLWQHHCAAHNKLHLKFKGLIDQMLYVVQHFKMAAFRPCGHGSLDFIFYTNSYSGPLLHQFQ